MQVHWKTSVDPNDEYRVYRVERPDCESMINSRGYKVVNPGCPNKKFEARSGVCGSGINEYECVMWTPCGAKFIGEAMGEWRRETQNSWARRVYTDVSNNVPYFFNVLRRFRDAKGNLRYEAYAGANSTVRVLVFVCIRLQTSCTHAYIHAFPRSISTCRNANIVNTSTKVVTAAPKLVHCTLCSQLFHVLH